VTRPPLTFFLAAVAILIGMAGLVRGSVPQSAGNAAARSTASVDPIVVGGAYVR
jgi:hypothetical protein